MKNVIFFLALTLILGACGSGGTGVENASSTSVKGSGTLSTSMDTMSYAVGNYFGKQFQTQGIDVSPAQMAQGFQEGFSGKSYMDAVQSKEFIMAYQNGVRTRQGKPYTKEDPSPFPVDSLSYAMGADFGMQMEKFGMDLNAGAFLQGAADIFTEGDSKFDNQQVDQILRQFSQEMQKKQMAKSAAEMGPNIEKGKTFIASKAKEDGVKSTPSGLHYKVLKAGTGASPKATDKVKVHYHGTLIDGTVFDSSYDRGTPAEFGLNQVIRGWTEGVQLMNLNSKFQFYIPHDLAYGERGSPPNIGPGETLIFDVELLEIK